MACFLNEIYVFRVRFVTSWKSLLLSRNFLQRKKQKHFVWRRWPERGSLSFTHRSDIVPKKSFKTFPFWEGSKYVYFRWYIYNIYTYIYIIYIYYRDTQELLFINSTLARFNPFHHYQSLSPTFPGVNLHESPKSIIFKKFFSIGSSHFSKDLNFRVFSAWIFLNVAFKEIKEAVQWWLGFFVTIPCASQAAEYFRV